MCSRIDFVAVLSVTKLSLSGSTYELFKGQGGSHDKIVHQDDFLNFSNLAVDLICDSIIHAL